MDLDINILNHISRDCSEYADRIRSLGEDVNVSTDRTQYRKKRDEYRYTGVNDNFFGIMRGWDQKSDWLVIMHDDLVFKDTLFSSIRHILPFAPDSPISFYIPTNKMFREAIKTNHVIKLHQGAWCQCVAYPVRYVDGILSWVDNNVVEYGRYSEDAFVWQYNCNMDECFYAVMPSLIQHDGFDRSVFGNPSSCAGNQRNSFCYEDFDVTSVDWSKEFKSAKYIKNRHYSPEGLKENYERIK
jgi:hypothetical protein